MSLTSDFTVYYADTDSYGVVWHGTYLRWLEAGRTDYLKAMGLDIVKLQNEEGIVLPVASLELKYIAPARCGDEVRVISKIDKARNTWVTFSQEIVNKNNPEIVYLRANLKCGGLDREGKLVKNMSELLRGVLNVC